MLSPTFSRSRCEQWISVGEIIFVFAGDQASQQAGVPAPAGMVGYLTSG